MGQSLRCHATKRTICALLRSCSPKKLHGSHLGGEQIILQIHTLGNSYSTWSRALKVPAAFTLFQEVITLSIYYIEDQDAIVCVLSEHLQCRSQQWRMHETNTVKTQT